MTASLLKSSGLFWVFTPPIYSPTLNGFYYSFNFQPLSNHFETVSNVLTTNCVTITRIFNSLLVIWQGLRILKIFSVSFIFTLWSTKSTKSTKQILFFSFLFLLFINIMFAFLVEDRWSDCILKSQRFLYFSLSKKGFGSCTYYRVKIQSYVHFLVDHLPLPVLSSHELLLSKFAAFTYRMINRFITFSQNTDLLFCCISLIFCFNICCYGAIIADIKRLSVSL